MPKAPENADPKPQIQAELQPWQVEALVISLIRHKQIRDEAKRLLKPTLFNLSGERFLEVAVGLLFTLDDQYPDRERVPYTALLNAAMDRVVQLKDMSAEQARLLCDTPANCDPADPRDEPGLIYRAYKQTTDEDVDPEQGRNLLKLFLLERDVHAPLRDAILQGGGGYLANYQVLYDEANRKRERIEGIDQNHWHTLKPPGGVFQAPLIIPSGVSFLDDLMDGGSAAPELIGLLAGTNMGKSTLISQLAISQARKLKDRVSTHGDPLRFVMLLSYEDNDQKWRTRAVSFAAGIKKSELNHATPNLSNLSRTGDLKPYERDHCKKHDKDPETCPGEYERYHQALEEIDNLLFINMDGEGLGGGGAEEVASLLARKQERDGIIPGMVLIDSLDLLVENHLAEGGFRGDLRDATRLGLESMVHRLRRKVAGRFNVPIWVTNQLAGANLKRQSGVKLSHADAMGSKGWAKGLDFHFAIGILDDKNATNCHCSKARRTGDRGKHKLVRLIGDFGHWRCIDANYTIHNNVVVEKDILLEVDGEVEALVPATEAVMLEDDGPLWKDGVP